MASRDYCSSVSAELEEWSEKLHKLSSDIDRIPSVNKYRLLPQIEELHIIMTELDDRLCDLMTACPTVDRLDTVEVVPDRGALATDFTTSKNEPFDYDFGG
jgi:hypothetical protein